VSILTAIITARQNQRKAKAVSESALNSKDFWEFASRLGYNYDRGYSYIRYPIECMLRGESIDVQKGSQVGLTQAVLVYVMWCLIYCQRDVFYMLPTSRECADFSSARFNPMVDLIGGNDFDADNVQHKRYLRANLYIRGANNHTRGKSKIKSVPVSVLVLDELDEISEDTQEQVEERLSGSVEKQLIRISTPSLADRGIALAYSRSWQHEYMLTCFKCQFEQAMTMDNNINIDAHSYCCCKCKTLWSHEQKIAMLQTGRWRTGEKNSETKGFFVSQLYSPTVGATDVCKKIATADNAVRKQALYNHKLGLPFSADGARLTYDYVTNVIGSINTKGLPIVAGVDVGYTWHHIVIFAVHEIGPIVIAISRQPSWEQIKNYLEEKRVTAFVVDSAPERSRARELVEDLDYMDGWMASYPKGIKGLFAANRPKGSVLINQTQAVGISRTEAIDIVLDRFRKDTILIDEHVSLQDDFSSYAQHICSVTRLYREVHGEVEAYYLESGADHYLHATVYAEIAAQIAGYGAPIKETSGGSFI
jgi:hypothetical protein